jgi:hypothetical protein
MTTVTRSVASSGRGRLSPSPSCGVASSGSLHGICTEKSAMASLGGGAKGVSAKGVSAKGVSGKGCSGGA